MQVAQPHFVGMVHDNGVGIGYIDAVFDYRSREQHVVFVIHKVDKRVLQVFWFHLSMRYNNTAIGHMLAYDVGQFGEICYAVVNEIHLSVSTHFEIDGISNECAIESCYLCMYRMAVWGRRSHHTHIASTHQ